MWHDTTLLLNHILFAAREFRLCAGEPRALRSMSLRFRLPPSADSPPVWRRLLQSFAPHPCSRLERVYDEAQYNKNEPLGDTQTAKEVPAGVGGLASPPIPIGTILIC